MRSSKLLLVNHRRRTGALMLFAAVMAAMPLIVCAGAQQTVHRSESHRPAHALAPPFALHDLDGHELSSARLRGKVVVLDFWATWCAPCKEEIPQLIELQNKYGAQGLQVIGISMDDEAEPVRAFASKYKMNYPVAMGDLKVATAYGGVLGLPVKFVVRRDGRIRARHRGKVNMSKLEAEIRALL